MPSGFEVTADGINYELRHVRFRPQGTGTPIKDFGNNAAIARTGIGTHTLTFSDKPKGFAGFDFSIGNNLANDIRPTVVSTFIYNESTGVLNFTIFADKTTAALAADIAANANNIVFMWVKFVGQAKI